MGKALAEAYPEARRVFEEADEALGYALSRLCFEGSTDDLKKTEVTQPAILTVSIAALRALERERPGLVPDLVAGHSLGEWSALVAAGALRFADAVRLVRERGRLMQEAVPLGEGAMSAVLGMAPEAVAEVVARAQAESPDSVVCVANFNSTEQTVISGGRAAVERANAMLLSAGAAKVVPLPVSAPFHSPLMAPAARGLEPLLARVEVSALRAPVVTNVEAAPNRDAARVKKLLIDQITAPVRWVEGVRWMAKSGVTLALELGPGKVLAGLTKRIERGIKVVNVEDPATLAKALEVLPG